MSTQVDVALARLFPAADPAAVFEDEEGQTYEDFVDMGKRKPNQKGTGRNKLTSKRNKILVLYFGREETKPPFIPTALSLLSSFFKLEVDYEEQFGSIQEGGEAFVLDGLCYDINIDKKEKKKKQKKRQKTDSSNSSSVDLEVFDLFDVLVHKAKDPYCSIVGLFENRLSEDGAAVMGRACGNRVCCVSLFYCDNLRCLLSTTFHELLHTLGVDHNTEERCVMNAIGLLDQEEWLFLSRTNLKKLHLMHIELQSKRGTTTQAKEENEEGVVEKVEREHTSFLRSYHSSMLETMEAAASTDFQSDCRWLRSVMKCLPSASSMMDEEEEGKA